MSVNIPKLYVQQFATNIQMKLQQKDSRFRSRVTEGQHYGEQAAEVDQVGKIAMLPVTSRFAPMGRVDADFDRRWVLPSDFELPQLIDSFDKLRLLTDPQSVYVQNAVAAANRQIDEIIIDAFTGTAKTGKTGSVSTSALAGNQIAVGFEAAGNIGLTVNKLIEAKRILMAAEVDIESDPLYCAISAKQHANLLKEVQVTSLDFNDRPVLVDGRIMRFMGFEFVHTELLSYNSGTIRSVPAWAKSGMHLGIWNDIETSVGQREDLSGKPYQAYLKMTIGATRLEEPKVVDILCDEA